jgi:hypothetical protein
LHFLKKETVDEMDMCKYGQEWPMVQKDGQKLRIKENIGRLLTKRFWYDISHARRQWLTPVMLATQAEIKRSWFKASQVNSSAKPYLEKTHHKKKKGW